MRQAIWVVMFGIALMVARGAAAQETAWVQIEAQPSLREAEERASAYAGAFANVNGFAMNTGWYAIALGPFTPDEAERQMAALKAERLIPEDSYLADGRRFGQQFWPVGGAALAATPAPAIPAPAVPEAPANTAIEPLPDTAALPNPVTPAVIAPEPEETPREARRSESELSTEARKDIQTALQWAGVYSSAIDGAFGPGTRKSMAAWQEQNGHEQTGVLTTIQRRELVEGYRAELAALGLELRRDAAAGIEMMMPTKLVKFSHYEPPFVHYDSAGRSGVRLILISQQGDQGSLYGLYDILQTLEIVPLDGPRERSSSAFELAGKNADLESYTYAALKGGLIKGFTLVWKPADEARMQRVLAAMKSSFAPVGETALDEGLGQPEAGQRPDLLSGLEIRKPEMSRSGFYVDAAGMVLTTSEVLGACSRITIDQDHEVDVVANDTTLGLALLRPRDSLSPLAFAQFQTETPRLQSEVAVAGYSYEDVLDAPVMTFGAIEDLKGLDGEPGRSRLALGALPGDAGGPVFDTSGAVLGMLLPKVTGGDRVLPDTVSFAAETAAITGLMTAHGVTPAASISNGALAAEDLTELALGMTVLVSCWK